MATRTAHGKHRRTKRGWSSVVSWPIRYVGEGRSHTRKGLRCLLLAFIVFLVVALWSFSSALVGPGSAPLSARAVEWVASHGGRGVVTWAETWWLDHHKPPVGGTPSGGIPVVAQDSPDASGSPTTPGKIVIDHLPQPPNVKPAVPNPLPNEGVWQPVGQKLDGIPTMYVSYFRPEDVHTTLVSAVVWMDQKLLTTHLVAGTKEPGGSGWDWPNGLVPMSARDSLAAAFNSGFYIKDSRGGYYSEGRTVAPLQDGAASMVIFKDGTATVGKWGRDVSMSDNVQSVRQNLTLIVDHGQPVAGLSADTSDQWGATYHNTVLAWRAAVGVTKNGALLFGCGDGLSAVSLADIMVRAGAVRAMELDINHVWVTFETCRPTTDNSDGSIAKNIISGMWVHPQRFLIPDERDFFAMLLRRPSELQRVPTASVGAPLRPGSVPYGSAT